jgi:glycosyltransferase involved in cell wall biosynthesis
VRMRLGIFPFLSGESGIYQYSVTLLQALAEWNSDNQGDVVVFADEVNHPALARRNGGRWTIRPASGPPPGLRVRGMDALRRAVGEGPHREAWKWLRRQVEQIPSRRGDVRDRHQDPSRETKEAWFRSCGIDLMVYPANNAIDFASGPPYVMVIHDLQHRIQPEFPEVSANGEGERRERYFRDAIQHATLLVTDSDVGKEDVLNYYGSHGATADRVKVLPFLPACYLAKDVSETDLERVRNKYRLPKRFLFYPAQFWAHKNHDRIVQALGSLKQNGVRATMVFCGSHTGEVRERNFVEVMSRVHQLSLDEDVRYLGYVDDQDMSGLYAAAEALVMPTFFGPTNIPVLEAWAFGCAVLTSDIRGIREQAGDAAVLVDPRSVDAIADGIQRLWTDEALRVRLAQLGRDRLALYTPTDFCLRLTDILGEAKRLLSRR